MRADISSWCCECRVCASHHVGKQVRPPITPIPVSGPFDRVGVDVLQLPKTTRGNIRYHVCGLFDQVAGGFCRLGSVSYYHHQSFS